MPRLPFRSLYIHFPLCETKCHYCDFYSLDHKRVSADEQASFYLALEREAALLAPLLGSSLETVFLGGGTPSLAQPDRLAQSLAPLRLSDRLTETTEWTIEANPSSVSSENLKAYRSMGVNRVSLGVQALRPDFLTWLGRVHGREQALHALDAIFKAGFTNVSVDLLCGIPGQALTDIEEALSRLSQFPITHLSCYLLTLPKHHAHYKSLLDEDTALTHLLFVDHWMTAQGFIHYEISNYAKPGMKSRHNLNYWKGGSYLGLGPSAHSFDAEKGVRSKNFSSLKKYADCLASGDLPREWQEVLTEEQKNLEKWMLALRLDDGFPKCWLKTESQRAKAQLFQTEGLLETHPILSGRLRPTPRGFALSDQVIRALA